MRIAGLKASPHCYDPANPPTCWTTANDIDLDPIDLAQSLPEVAPSSNPPWTASYTFHLIGSIMHKDQRESVPLRITLFPASGTTPSSRIPAYHVQIFSDDPDPVPKSAHFHDEFNGDLQLDP